MLLLRLHCLPLRGAQYGSHDRTSVEGGHEHDERRTRVADARARPPKPSAAVQTHRTSSRESSNLMALAVKKGGVCSELRNCSFPTENIMYFAIFLKLTFFICYVGTGFSLRWQMFSPRFHLYTKTL